jgi:hypothetical protein
MLQRLLPALLEPSGVLVGLLTSRSLHLSGPERPTQASTC